MKGKLYFNSSVRISALLAEASSWIGTPFAAHSCLKRAGVDCVHLAGAIYVAAGALEEFNPPPYSLDGGNHSETSQVLAWLEKHPAFEKVFTRGTGIIDDLRAGDLLCFRYARSEHHVGVMLGSNAFIHAPNHGRVCHVSLGDPIFKRTLTTAFRPLEK